MPWRVNRKGATKCSLHCVFISRVSALLCCPKSGFNASRGVWFGFLLYGKWKSGRENQMEEGFVYIFSIAKLYSAKRRGPFPMQVLFDLFSFFQVPSLCRVNLWTASVLVWKFAGTLGRGAGVSFPSLWPKDPHGQGPCTKWRDPYVGIPRSLLMGWDFLRSRCTSIPTPSSQLLSAQALLARVVQLALRVVCHEDSMYCLDVCSLPLLGKCSLLGAVWRPPEQVVSVLHRVHPLFLELGENTSPEPSLGSWSSPFLGHGLTLACLCLCPWDLSRCLSSGIKAFWPLVFLL